MVVRIFSVLTLTTALVFTGCGGKDEVKKNEGVIVNTMPGAASGPGGPAPGGGPPPTSNSATAPPVPASGSK